MPSLKFTRVHVTKHFFVVTTQYSGSNIDWCSFGLNLPLFLFPFFILGFFQFSFPFAFLVFVFSLHCFLNFYFFSNLFSVFSFIFYFMPLFESETKLGGPTWSEKLVVWFFMKIIFKNALLSASVYYWEPRCVCHISNSENAPPKDWSAIFRSSRACSNVLLKTTREMICRD